MTKAKFYINILISGLLFAVFSGSVVAQQNKPLNQDELDRVFSGKTAIGRHVSKNLEVKDYYARKGKFVSLRSNGERLPGKWWVSKKRDAICVKYKHKPKVSYCRAVVKDAKGGYNKIRAKDDKILVQYHKIVKGNKTRIAKK